MCTVGTGRVTRRRASSDAMNDDDEAGAWRGLVLLASESDVPAGGCDVLAGGLNPEDALGVWT